MICFNLQDALHHFQANGINTHNTPYVHTRHTARDHCFLLGHTNQNVQGADKRTPSMIWRSYHYQLRKNAAGNNILTGVTVYSIISQVSNTKKLSSRWNEHTNKTRRLIQHERDRRQNERQKYEERHRDNVNKLKNIILTPTQTKKNV